MSCTPGTLLAPDDRVALPGLGICRTFEPGQTLVSEGPADAASYLLLRGCTKVMGNSAGGRPVLLSIRLAGDLVGELSALDGKPRSTSVAAATPVAGRRCCGISASGPERPGPRTRR